MRRVHEANSDVGDVPAVAPRPMTSASLDKLVDGCDGLRLQRGAAQATVRPSSSLPTPTAPPAYVERSARDRLAMAADGGGAAQGVHATGYPALTPPHVRVAARGATILYFLDAARADAPERAAAPLGTAYPSHDLRRMCPLPTPCSTHSQSVQRSDDCVTLTRNRALGVRGVTRGRLSRLRPFHATLAMAAARRTSTRRADRER